MGYMDTGTAFIENEFVYKGFFSAKIEYKRSPETPIKLESVYNKIEGIYLHSPNTQIDNNASVIKIKASAPYPFLKYFASNIDFSLTITAFLDINTKSVKIVVKGSHDEFPAYELLVNNQLVYNYNPSKKGHTGLGLINLNTSIDFTAFNSVRIDDVSINLIFRKIRHYLVSKSTKVS